MSNFNIAVYILFYEKVDQTIECVKSFLPSGLNIYILNNNSSLNSREILADFCKDYDNIKIFDSKENLGVSKGRNFLIKNTQEEWMFFVDNDITIQTSNWLEKAVSHINNSPEFMVFTPKLYDLQSNSYQIPPNFVKKNNEIFYSLLKTKDYSNVILGGCSIINRKVFVELGLYDEELFIGLEDYEFAIRALIRNQPIKAKLIDDINLIHDHRIVKKIEDQNAVKERYREEHMKNSLKRIEDKYGVVFKLNWKRWNDNQLKLMLKGKDLTFIIFNYLSKFKKILINIKAELYAKK